MTSQTPDQMPLPGPLTAAALPGAPDKRRCRQPGCGSELPAVTGRGAPRLFCSPACSRKWHNDHRPAAGQQAAADPGPAPGGPLAGLHQLLAQAASLVASAAAELAAADHGRVSAALAAADAASRQAQAETAMALAQAAGALQSEQAATAAMHAARADARAAMEAADTARADADAADTRAQAAGEHAVARIAEIRGEADAAVAAASTAASAAHADRDAALSAAGQARHHADTEISRARQAEADARAENDHVLLCTRHSGHIGSGWRPGPRRSTRRRSARASGPPVSCGMADGGGHAGDVRLVQRGDGVLQVDGDAVAEAC